MPSKTRFKRILYGTNLAIAQGLPKNKKQLWHEICYSKQLAKTDILIWHKSCLQKFGTNLAIASNVPIIMAQNLQAEYDSTKKQNIFNEQDLKMKQILIIE